MSLLSYPSVVDIHDVADFSKESDDFVSTLMGDQQRVQQDNSHTAVQELSHPEEVDNVSKAEVNTVNDFDLVAKQLAGIQLKHQAQNNNSYLEYVSFIDNAWKELEKESIGHIDGWTAQHVSPHTQDADRLFYPFAGPDITYAVKFFPNVRDYVLVGLERLGNFNKIKANISNDAYILSLKNAIRHYLHKGYFVTSYMQQQLCEGGLALILLQLAKLKFTVDSVSARFIDDEGNVTDSGDLPVMVIKCRSVIGEAKTIYYIRMDLGNKGQFIDRLMNFVMRAKFATLIKSASYVLHDVTFSRLRGFILNYTRSILQDDSGIPFVKFDNKWEKYVFGVYTKPTLPVFQIRVQPTLAAYFQSEHPQAIPFKIGYGFNQARPNLLLAIPLTRKLAEQQALLEMKKTDCGCGR